MIVAKGQNACPFFYKALNRILRALQHRSVVKGLRALIQRIRKD